MALINFGKTSLGLFAAASILACSSPVVMAQPTNTTANQPEAIRTLSVSGTGKATAKPDMASIQFSVETRGKTAKEALTINAERMNAVISALKNQRVLDKDIQTNGLSLNIEYARDQNGRYQNQKIDGYRVYNTVTARLRDVSKVGEIIDKTIGAGANRMNSLSFSFSDDSALRNKARKAAVTDATAKAQLYAQEAGISLGKVLAISEPGSSTSRPFAVRGQSMAMEDLSASTPIATGESSISAQINMIFEIN